MNDRVRVDVAVVGAGLSGLAAAWELRQLGHSAIVLEARDRVGGRAWTIREGFQDGQHAEGGGDLIDGSQEEIHKLASDLGLELTRILRGGWGFVRPDGRGRPHIVRRGVAHGWERLAKQVAAFKEPYRLAERRGVERALRAVVGWSEADLVRAWRQRLSQLTS